MSNAALAAAVPSEADLAAAAKAAADALDGAGSKPKPDSTERAKLPETLYVLDTTALPSRGPREHEMIVSDARGQKLRKAFKFEPGVPLELPFAVAIKFLKIPEFKRSDKDGNLLPYQRQPKQPNELGAGERFALADHQTVADYHELATMNLLQRVYELPGGELLEKSTDRENIPAFREKLINFLIRTTVERREANAARASGIAPKNAPARDVEIEEFEPEAFEE